ncbi:pseudouridine synthase [Kingella potus]|uniref:pseudouridine synthase n=1 Tax=Kingella potus TaxID=265175 RepID=UPI001FD460D2|nr:pseudouridine synthase [Kingella potus]UOP00822.1 pseudouridine synthase [Kingella potus]
MNGQEPVRLSKRMAELGLCSRREADVYIERGWVKVNGTTAVLGQKVTAADRIDLAREAHETQARRVTVILNKPVGYVSGQPEKGYRAAAELITPENRWENDGSRIPFDKSHLRGLAPAGRLDIDSVGLLVLTQDGRTAKQLVGENSGSEKEYLVRVKGRLKENGLALLNHGLILDGEPLRPAKVEWQNTDQLRFVLRQGKKRQIRRMCELVGLSVTGLKRIRIGLRQTRRTAAGKWRYLAPGERF